MGRSKDTHGGSKLLGSIPFVSRTFEGHFTDTPFVLDMDANLHIGPADHVSRDEHSAIEVVFHFLTETDRINAPVREVLRNRRLLLDAFAAFDAARVEAEEHDFRIRLHGTYDDSVIRRPEDDDLPAGPCGQAVNQVKLRFYGLCRRLDPQFDARQLSVEQREAEKRILASSFNRAGS